MTDHPLAPIQYLIETAPWLTTLWIGFVGGAIGSFLNVVVYRTPRGMSLSHPPSHCPHCDHRIRWRDNVPVIGWLLLAGQCRDCQAKISMRYPLVEAVMAVVFALQWHLDVTLGDQLLSDRLAAFSWHVVSLSCLLCAALIDLDGQAVPGRLFGFALVTSVCLLMWRGQGEWGPTFADQRGWPAVILSAALGGPLAHVAHRLARIGGQPRPEWVAGAIGAVVGGCLGPAGVIAVMLLATTATVVARAIAARRSASPPHSITWALAVAALTWIGVVVW